MGASYGGGCYFAFGWYRGCFLTGGVKLPLDALRDAYLWELRAFDGSETLLVNFSSSQNHSFYTSRFRCHVLFIADKNYTYFTEGADALAASIAYAARQLNCRRIITMGGSKGGYAALLHAALGAKNREATYHAIAFGPQTLIYPRNHNIEFPSYLRLIEKAKGDERLRREMELFGMLPDVFPTSATADVYFSERSECDRVEALRLSGPTVKFHPLPMTGHLAHIPFVVNTTDETAVRSLIERAYAQGQKIGDQMDDQRAIYVEELMAMPRQPNIIELVAAASS